MKKISALFIAGLITLCFSMSLHAQYSDNKLDQQELMKQFIGSWIADDGIDTTILWEILPYGKGYDNNFFWKKNGKTFQTAKGVIGFTWNFKTVNMYFLWDNGMMDRDMGKFVSDKKMTLERFNAHYSRVTATSEVNFITKDEIVWRMKWGSGEPETWNNANVYEWTFFRTKE